MLEFIKQNYKWIFSGIGVPLVVSLVSLFFKNRFTKQKSDKNNKQKLNVKNNSTAFQAGGNITINEK